MHTALTASRTPQVIARQTRPRRAQVPLLSGILAAVFAFGWAAGAAVPAAEKLLPEDTLVLVTTPDFAKAREVWTKLPQRQFWADPAMKPFRDHFVSKWQEEFVQPLERELGFRFDDYADLARGQSTFALTQNGWEGREGQAFGLLLLLDARDQDKRLRRSVDELRKKWVEAGKSLRTEKIQGLEFTVLSLSSNTLPRTLRWFFPQTPELREAGGGSDLKNVPPGVELVFGQAGSLLVVGNSLKVVEGVVGRLTGGSAPALEGVAAYQANHLAFFRDASVYGWVNSKSLLEIWGRRPGHKATPQAPNPFDLKPEKLMAASGLSGVKAVAFSFQHNAEGELAQLFLGAPQTNRQGLLKILAGEPKESSPPPFVPAEVTKFRRWRIDGQKTWATLQQMLAEFSPQAVGTVNFLLDSANAYARQKDPGFDIRTNLIGNLGDDMLSYAKVPRDSTPAESRSPSSLFLLGSPNAEQLAAAFKGILVYLSQQVGTPPVEREFLGRKVFSVVLAPLPFRIGGAGAVGPHTLHYAASGGYVAITTDVSLLEEYLRGSETRDKALRDLPGLAEAAQRVTGSGASLFGYENRAECMREVFESLRRDGGSGTNASGAAITGLLSSSLGLPGAGALNSLKGWMDFSLLPPFDKVSRYFSFNVYSGSANVDGLAFKRFAPVPPGLRAEEPAAKR